MEMLQYLVNRVSTPEGGIDYVYRFNSHQEARWWETSESLRQSLEAELKGTGFKIGATSFKSLGADPGKEFQIVFSTYKI